MVWECRFFPSGTTIVTDGGIGPWLYVYGPGNDDEDAYVRDRIKCCYELMDFMNGGQRPAWLLDLTRVSETHAEDLDHTSITAIGPMIDIDPPNLNWSQDNSNDAHNARSRLMDKLFLISQKREDQHEPDAN